ncbi:hypothetical protein BJ741DRAFT_588395 [Chytriomyces cf. hyalinus JEL632]|nr:hypothetical protein BJ741DRAFT_588395 [Chytriomyces cf. hyalinus JEL632]
MSAPPESEDKVTNNQVEAAHTALKKATDALVFRLQNRVFVDQVRKFCGEETEQLRDCRELNNRNPDSVCAHAEKLLDKCTETNVRLITNFRQTCRNQIAKQEDCIAGVFKGQRVGNSTKSETCDTVINDLADCVGGGWTTRKKKSAETSTLRSFLGVAENDGK